MKPNRDCFSDQTGFSLVEVLVVLVISSAILVSLSSMVLMSQRSVAIFSEANEANSEFFFFEAQLMSFVRSISIEPHPDAEEPCRLEGDAQSLNGCFYNIFSEDQKLERFELKIETAPSGARVAIQISDTPITWFEHDSTVSLSFIDNRNAERDEWPPVDRGVAASRGNASSLEEEEPLPQAMIIRMEPSAELSTGRKLIASFGS